MDLVEYLLNACFFYTSFIKWTLIQTSDET